MSQLYFAFGSNMLTARITARCPSAAPRGAACLHGHVLRFHKRSKDGSGKANALHTGQELDLVWGVLIELTAVDLAALDRAEGKCYQRVELRVLRENGEAAVAWVYVADPDSIDDRLKPTAGYLQLVVDGAKEHGLPAEYVRQLEGVGR